MVSLPNGKQIQIGSEHIISSAAGIIGTLASLSLLDADAAAAFIAALKEIGDGIGKIVAGISAAVVAGTTIVAGLRGNPIVQMILGAKAVAANPELAANAAQLSTNDKVAIAEGAVAIASHSDTASKALIANVVQLDKVQAIVTDPATAAEIPDERVVPAT